MIFFLTTHRHRYTHRAVRKLPGAPTIRRWSYWRLFHAFSVPRATYVFTDFDRLGPWELELAARSYRKLAAGGAQVLNDPALYPGRAVMLERFRQVGASSFLCWSPVLDQRPDRFPVFLRTQAAHRGPLTGLLETAEAADTALADALAEGYALRDLLFIEYAAAPNPNGVFMKRAAYRIGDRMVPAPSVNADSWIAKHGVEGVAGAAAYAEELATFDQIPHAETLKAAFEAVGLEYGRADFALVDGRLQLYEINSNPMIGGVRKPHPFEDRERTLKLASERYAAALTAIDTDPGGPRIRLDGRVFARQRWRDLRWHWMHHWLP